jgi:cation diffusion facilitator family transporter
MTELLIRLFVKNSNDTKDEKVRESYGRMGGIVGIACNVLLCTIKLLIGFFAGSMSIIADGLNNLSDMGSSVITMIGFKMAGKPADNEHPFGHGRIEYMSAFIVAASIIVVGIELLRNSASELISGVAAPTYAAIDVIVLCISVALKFWMFLFNRKLGKKVDSEALTATAQDSINDVITTSAILASILVSMFIKVPFNLDAVMACAVALFIIWSGLSTARDTLDELLGKPPEKELVKEIERIIMSYPEFVGMHDLMIHNYGPGRQFASVHVEVPQDINIVKCHEQIDLCEKQLAEKTKVQVVIHMDPIDVNNETVRETRHSISSSLKKIDSRMTLHDFRMTPVGEKKTNLIFDVVIPPEVKESEQTLSDKINASAREINPTYCCVITFDRDYSGAQYLPEEK